MPTAERRISHRVAIGVFLGAALLALIPAAAELASQRWDPTALLRVGRFAASRPAVERDFGDATLTEDYGHDGQQFYVLATRFPDLAAADGEVDKLRYRARRILVPAVVAPLPDGAPTVWGMLALNAIAVGAAAVALAVLAQRAGTSPWLGLVVGVTPAMVESTQGSLADAPAFALALWGVVVSRRHPWGAAALLLAAALARETALVAALACLLVAAPRARLALATPFVGFAAWAVVVSWWLPPTPGASSQNLLRDALAQFTTPFAGWFAQGPGGDALVVGVLLAGAGLAAAWILRSRLPEVAWWLVLDTLLLVVAADAVTTRPMNFARVAPLAVPALAIALGVLRSEGRTPSDASASSAR